MALTSSAEQPQPLRVIVLAVKGWVEKLSAVWVTGQLIEIRRRAGASTHFLTLRDPLADVSARLTVATSVLDAAGPLTEGTTVTAQLRPTMWTKSGQFTFECLDLRPSGEGRLLAQLEQRKRMLQAEGLFDPARRRRLPFLPRRVGLITAQGSAAERDVLVNIADRWPGMVVDVRPCPMQGGSCVEQVIAALGSLDRAVGVDVIVIARGGGSLEDLLPFSDEAMVRAVSACRTPVVSAIGHETDTPIVDLVADLRASTPTDAAKRVVPDLRDELAGLSQARQRLTVAIERRLDAETKGLADIRSRPVLRDPLGGFDVHVDRLAEVRHRLDRAIRATLASADTDIAHQLTRVRSLSPSATLARGYAILADDQGRTVGATVQTGVGAHLVAHLSDGTLGLDVTSTHPSPARQEPT